MDLYVLDQCPPFGKRQVGRGRMDSEEKACLHFRYTCSCTSAAPSSWRCGCASPAAAGGCSGLRWVGAAGSVPWRSGQSSHRRPGEQKAKLHVEMHQAHTLSCPFTFILHGDPIPRGNWFVLLNSAEMSSLPSSYLYI